MDLNLTRFLRVVLFILILVVSDKVLGLILRKLYFSQTGGQNYALTYSLSECKADVLIVGNSRAQHHYDSSIFSSLMRMSCYNAGQDGGHSIILSYAEIKLATKRYSPKLIILEFSPTGILHYEGDYDRLSILLPYYHDYPDIRPIILMRSPYERIKLMSSIYPFNSNIINIIGFNTKAAELRRSYNGFVPLNEVLNNNMLKPASETLNQSPIDLKSAVDPNMINALENIIDLCKEKNITLFIVNSPVFHEANEKQNELQEIAQISMKIIRSNKVNFIDYSYEPTFAGHPELFADKAHLNNKGAEIFSDILAKRIAKTIEYNPPEEKLTLNN